MSFVVDASVALAWCFSDESNSHSTSILEKIQQDGAIVPALWSLEISNTLIMAERRKRLTYAEIIECTVLLDSLPIVIDHEIAARTLREIFTLARAEKLTTYDATYLELAMRRGVPIATKDQQLLQAAKRLGLEHL